MYDFSALNSYCKFLDSKCVRYKVSIGRLGFSKIKSDLNNKAHK